MIIELLRGIVRTNKMYVEWKATPVTSADHEQIRLLFKNYEKGARNATEKAKKHHILTESSLNINATLKRQG